MIRPTVRFRGTRTLAALCLVLGALLGPPSSLADDLVVPTTLSDTPPRTFEGIDPSAETIELPLDQAIRHALEHNVSLVVQRYERESSLLGIKEAYGIYDFQVDGTVATSSSARPPSSLLEDADIVTSDTDTWNFTLSRNLKWGGGVQLDMNNRRTESSDDFVQPNPQFVLNWSVGFRQPLLEGFGQEITEQGITVARRNTAINHTQFQTQVESVIGQVSDTYWDLVGAKAQLAVAEESLELAKELHEMNRIQVEVGTLAPLEMVQSEAGVANREEDIIRRIQAVEDAEDLLRRLVNLEQGSLWGIPIEPVTAAEIEHRSIDVAAAVQAAVDNRPDLRRQRLLNENLALDAKVAQNAVKPSLDLSGGYGYNAVAGTIDTTGPDGTPILIDDGYSDALESILEGEFEGWQIQLTLSMPIENRAAKARAAQADLAVEQGKYELRDLEDGVLLEVRRAARAVETAAKAIESAKVSSKLQQKNLEAEQKRYENGLSTSFQVLEIQEDLSAARSGEVAAVISYRKALTAFQQATGQLLDAHGVKLAGGGEDDED